MLASFSKKTPFLENGDRMISPRKLGWVFFMRGGLGHIRGKILAWKAGDDVTGEKKADVTGEICVYLNVKIQIQTL